MASGRPALPFVALPPTSIRGAPRDDRSLRLDRALRGAFGADALDRLGGSTRLGSAPGRTLADAEQLPVDPDFDPERLLVVRTGRLDEPVVGPLT